MVNSGKTIGTSRLQDSLYVLNRSRNVIGNQAAFEDMNVNRKILQLHRRLGHPSFFTLEKLYFILFKRTSIDSLFCNSYELFKRSKSSYHVSNYRSSTPFITIHSNI